MMAHFAQIDENNIVTQVLVVPDNAEDRGQDYLANDLGLGGTWVQTSYNNRIRKNYAGVGFTYDANRDAFIAPKPFDSWVLNEDTCRWEAPIAYPTDGVMYKWNEDKKDWEAIVNE
jgi:hypothetical protein